METLLLLMLEYEWLGNTVREYLIAAFVFFGIVLSLKLFQRLTLHRFARLAELTQTNVDNAVVKIIQTIKPPFYWFLAFYAAVQFLHVRGVAATVITTILVAWVTFQVIVALQIFIQYFIKKRFIREDDRSSEVVSEILSVVSKIALWSIGVLFVLSNLGVNITSLIAGLGIGGLAVALALQNVLGDLFSSLAIYFDRPFAPGDFIVAGDTSGTVQKVGIKTTRIKSLLGEEVVVPNKDLASSKIQNFKRMERRRVDFAVGVTYDTPQEKMKKIPEMIKNIISSVEKVSFDRAHFNEFGEFALKYDIVYHVESREFNVYMDIHQQILLDIKEAFEKEGIQIAYPTQTVYVAKES